MQEFVVRLYVLRGTNLMSMDPGGYSDPYLKVAPPTTPLPLPRRALTTLAAALALCTPGLGPRPCCVAAR